MSLNQKGASSNLNLRLLKKILINFSKKEENPIITYNRSLRILSLLQGQTLLIHNGKKFKALRITKSTLGHKLGEFSPTRILHNFKQKHVTRKKKK